jgi:manganese transport protein
MRALGPAFVAAVAYVDPGNVAANVSAGARYGYLLLWVLVLANAVAMLVQYLSAKLGLVTGRSLPATMGTRLRPTSRRLYWVQAEIVAAATDIAEVIGGALALSLLFGVPLPVGGALVGAASLVLLSVQTAGQRRFEVAVMVLLAVVMVGFLAGLAFHGFDVGAAGSGLVPRLDDSESVLLAVSMVGATVMPHAIYLHSALVGDRHGSNHSGRQLRRYIVASRWDVAAALVLAGAVNIGILVLAASGLQGRADVDGIEGAHAAITDGFGPVVGVLFGVGLLASGLASASVGSYAGAVVMSGLLGVRVPLLVRRLVTMVPALLLLVVGVDPTWALIVSQVVLSFGISFALIPLIRLTSDRDLMGAHVNARWTTGLATAATGLIVVLNATLIVLVFR